MHESLQESRRWCAKFCRRSKSSFYYSFALLDQPRRQAMHALYAFARFTDDLGDSSETPAERTSQLVCWQDLLRHHCGAADARSNNLATDRSSHLSALAEIPIWPALADAVLRFRIPVSLLEDIICGVTMDVKHQQPSDWLELQHYCYHVASAVGVACTHIWRPEPFSEVDSANQSKVQAAIDCGLAFQLTNILRDIAEDARVGRVYLPQSHFATYNIDRTGWLAEKPTGNWEALLDEVAERTREFYTSGWQTIYGLTPSSQRMFSLMWRSYRGLLESVVADKHRLWSTTRVRLSRRKRLSLLTTHFLTPIYARLPSP